MTKLVRRVDAACVLALVVSVACTSARPSAAQNPAPLTPAAIASADSGRPPYIRADVRFMQGMIHHHAQAVVMARLAPARSASNGVRVLAERIDVAQRDEIDFMQGWLKERGEMVPDPLAHHGAGDADRETHRMASDTLMPGMLTPRQMAQLQAGSGAEFDRLFLTFMIQHHEGALMMVQELFSNEGAAQDTYVWKFASDVEADQSTEIERMQTMLDTHSEGRQP